MCEACNVNDETADIEKDKKPKRLWLWDFNDNVHCPLIGTCLTTQDLLNLTRRLKLEVNPECKDYDLHSYFVAATAKKCREAKAIHKLLDERHTGALRKFRRLASDQEILELWNEMKQAGQIAGAFYALMTLSHVSSEVRGMVFGEVHMLSHLMGASYRERSLEVAVLKSRLDEVHTKKLRVESGLHEALEERDQKIAELEKHLQEAKAKSEKAQTLNASPGKRRNTDRKGRAVEIARAKARSAEQAKEKLEASNREYRQEIMKLRRAAACAYGIENRQEMPPKLDGTSILYVGGRPRQISHLEKTADNFGAKFFHHDGGKEDAITRIDEVLPSVDCVFCPVDCISHDACLRVKAGCKKHGKAFIPLRSSSQTTLKQALLSLNGSRT